jgi:hypothetical protein
MGTRVGRPIAVGQVLSTAARMIMKTPALLIPQAIVFIIAVIGDVVSRTSLSAAGFAVLLVTFIVAIIVAGTYPAMVQSAIAGQPLDIGHALRHAASRFATLLVAGIVVGVIILVGFVALIVPGIIFVTWYAYAIPAIMLENKGVFAGMSASKAFGRDKKWATFLMFLAILVVALIVSGIGDAVGLASALAGRIVTSLLEVPVEAWAAVIITYTYITYGPSSVPAGTPGPEVITPGVLPAPSMVQPAVGVTVPVGAPPKFCRNCGSPLESDARFCPDCGQPVT